MNTLRTFYVATRSQAIGRTVRSALEGLGFACGASWLDEQDYGQGSATLGEKSVAQRAAIALLDEREVRAADFLVLVSEPDGSYVPGGKHVETGMALALRKPVHVVGRRENVFHYHPRVVVHETLGDLVAWLSA